jgi:hypothetical protein
LVCFVASREPYERVDNHDMTLNTIRRCHGHVQSNAHAV